MVDSGHIEITVKPDGDDILLIVADDGIGREPEQVAALLQNEPSDRTGIGVKNVNDRLRIYFGAEDVYKRQVLHRYDPAEEGTFAAVYCEELERQYRG